MLAGTIAARRSTLILLAVVAAASIAGMAQGAPWPRPAPAQSRKQNRGPANTALPVISGTAQVAQTLTSSPGNWAGSTPISYAFQWQRCNASGANCTPISGATGSSYSLQPADTGLTLRSRVTASNSSGTATATSAQTAPVQAAAASSPPAQNSRFGIAVGGNFQNESASDQAADLDQFQSAGAGWVRIDINWNVVQYTGSSSYNWAPFDKVVTQATQRGFDVLATIVYTPPWARPAGATDSTWAPANAADYAAFAAKAVARYAPMGVHAWEIWNEPNISANWKPAPDPAAYTALLKAAYTAIKTADPAATVITGGTSPAPDDGTNIAPVTFLSGIYANGGKGYFDAVAHHPYCSPAMPGNAYAWSAWYQMYGTSPSLRSVMETNGDSAKKIWATEYGTPTNGPSGSYVSEATQAQMITQAYQLFGSYSWAGPLFIYSGRDSGTNTSTNQNFYGLIRNDFSQKPAYAAYQRAAAGL